MFKLFTARTAVWFEERAFMSALPAVGGLYVISRPGLLELSHLYIGKADDLDARVGSGIARHEHWSQFVVSGATTVSICCVESAADRDALERDLIASYCPPLNDQHNWLRTLLEQNPLRGLGV